MDLTIGSLRAGDEEQRWALMRQAFGGTQAFDPELPALDPDRAVCAHDGDRLVGTVLTFDFAQTWGGRAVPCGGVSGVAVAPEVRGRSAARRMLAESFARMGRRGEVVACLYPTVSALYRSVGFEVVGFHERRSIPLGGIRTDAGPLAWRPLPLGDPLVAELHDRMAAGHDGWFRGDPGWWAFRGMREARETSVNRFCFVGARAGVDVAVVQYRYGTSETAMYDLEVEVLAGLDGDAIGAALLLLAGHGSTAGAVRTTVPPSVLGTHVPELQRTKVVDDWPFMLRLVDVPGAIGARGWPGAVQGRVELLVVDEVLPANAGPHVLEVADGEASLVRGGAGTIRVTAQDLAVLYAGGDVAALRAAGRLAEATPADVDLLAAAFVSNPTLPLFF